MLWLIKILICGHVHKWKEDSRHPLEQTWGNGGKSTGLRVHCTCETCGLPAKFDLV